MLKRVGDIVGRKLHATDGEIGKVRDLYFDDDHWTVRYLVAATGAWLSGRDVLISPASVESAQPEEDSIATKLTRRQVEESPGVDTDRPVSRRYEAAHAEYFGYPYYWAGPYLWGPGAVPIAGTPTARRDVDAGSGGDAHLRSSAEVSGCRIEATDGSIGHVVDFIVEVESWAIHYMLVDTRDWLPGKHMLIAPHLIERVDWPRYAVHLRLGREEVKESPEYGR